MLLPECAVVTVDMLLQVLLGALVYKTVPTPDFPWDTLLRFRLQFIGAFLATGGLLCAKVLG